MNRKLVKNMNAEEHAQFKKDLQAKKDYIRSLSDEERALYEKKCQRKWSDDYLKAAYDTVNFRTPKSGKEVIKRFAEENGYTLNDFLRKMVCEGMKKEGYEFDPSLIYPKAVMPEDL